MARRKRVHPMLRVARAYTQSNRPDLVNASMRLRQLDGPPEAPRFAVNIEGCLADECPFGVPHSVAAAGQCDHVCSQRDTCRLLIMRNGQVVSATDSSEHYS